VSVGSSVSSFLSSPGGGPTFPCYCLYLTRTAPAAAAILNCLDRTHAPPPAAVSRMCWNSRAGRRCPPIGPSASTGFHSGEARRVCPSAPVHQFRDAAGLSAHAITRWPAARIITCQRIDKATSSRARSSGGAAEKLPNARSCAERATAKAATGRIFSTFSGGKLALPARWLSGFGWRSCTAKSPAATAWHRLPGCERSWVSNSQSLRGSAMSKSIGGVVDVDLASGSGYPIMPSAI